MSVQTFKYYKLHKHTNTCIHIIPLSLLLLNFVFLLCFIICFLRKWLKENYFLIKYSHINHIILKSASAKKAFLLNELTERNVLSGHSRKHNRCKNSNMFQRIWFRQQKNLSCFKINLAIVENGVNIFCCCYWVFFIL